MRSPVEYVRISAKNRDILIKIKRRTGLEHWNEICRIAYCRSLANPAPPVINHQSGNIVIDIEWKTFAGLFHKELTAITLIRAAKDNIKLNNKDALNDYFRSHLERGISSLQNIKNLQGLLSTNDQY
jgi:DNA sulfur modification protein DndE